MSVTVRAIMAEIFSVRSLIAIGTVGCGLVATYATSQARIDEQGRSIEQIKVDISQVRVDAKQDRSDVYAKLAAIEAQQTQLLVSVAELKVYVQQANESKRK